MSYMQFRVLVQTSQPPFSLQFHVPPAVAKRRCILLFLPYKKTPELGPEIFSRIMHCDVFAPGQRTGTLTRLKSISPKSIDKKVIW